MSTTCINCTTTDAAQRPTRPLKTHILPQFGFVPPRSTSYHNFRGCNGAKIFGCIHQKSNICDTCLNGFKQKRGLPLLPPRLGGRVRRVAPEWTRFDVTEAWEATLAEIPRDEWPESASGTVIDETGSGPPGTSDAR
jgi:hypothetical protein